MCIHAMWRASLHDVILWELQPGVRGSMHAWHNRTTVFGMWWAVFHRHGAAIMSIMAVTNAQWVLGAGKRHSEQQSCSCIAYLPCQGVLLRHRCELRSTVRSTVGSNTELQWAMSNCMLPYFELMCALLAG